MNKRYKITRENDSLLTIEECQNFFSTHPDFVYMDSFGASQDGVHMKIAGHFFMWQVENVQIPFRFFEGEIYVAVSHPAVLDKALQLASQLDAVCIEG